MGELNDWRSLPRKRKGTQKTKMVAFRVTDGEFKRLAAAAKKSKRSMSNHLRYTFGLDKE